MRRWLVIVSLALHFALIAVLFVVGAWRIDRLEAGRHKIDLAVQLPPPPEKEGGPAKAPEFTHKPHKEIPKDMVVPPDHVDKDVAVDTATKTGTGEGAGSGEGSGSGSGKDTDGPCLHDCGPPQSEAKPVEQKHEVKIVPPTVLRALRISGETQIQPPELVKSTMLHEGHDRVTASFQVCLDENGGVTSIKMRGTSGYSEYDTLLSAAMHGWRYHPYMIDNRPTAVCGVVTFIYTMK